MEKKSKAKEVKMSAVQGGKGQESQQKLTYDQLNDACNQLFQQNQYLVKQIRQLNDSNMFRRLDYLFKVVEFSEKFDAAFVKACSDEITEAVTPVSEEEQGEKGGE